LKSRGFQKAVRFNVKPTLTPPANHVPVLLTKYTGTNLRVRAGDNAQDWDDNSFYQSEEGFTFSEVIGGYKSYIRRAFMVDNGKTPIDDDYRRKLKVFWERRGNVLWQAKVLPLNFLNNAIYPVYADSLLSYDSDTDDAAYNNQGKANWALARDTDPCDNIAVTQGDLETFASSIWRGDGTYRVYRSYFPFNTASLPDAATITGADLKMSVTGIFDNDNDAQGYIAVCNCDSHPTPPTDSTTADWDQFNDVDGGNVDLSNITDDQYNTWTLNATGYGWISKTGWTKLGLREGHDLEDSAIDVQANAGNTLLGYYGEEANEEPTLEVTYLNNYTLACATGSYAHTGSTMTPLAARKLVLATGSYAHTGATMTPLATRTLACATGVYLHTGATMTPTYRENVTISPATFSIVMVFNAASVSLGTGSVHGSEIHMFMDMSMN
jgi:hypothetical protein